MHLDFFRALHGRWHGRGRGRYPTLDDFSYREETAFEFDPAYPLVHFVQRTWLDPDGEPAHWESGILRPIDDGDIELSNAQDGGRVEVLRGSVAMTDDALTCALRHIHLGNDARLVSTERRFTVVGDELRYEVWMATRTTPEPRHQNHLVATLRRR